MADDAAFADSRLYGDIFRAMNDITPLGILVTDVEGNCVYTNPTFRSLARVENDDISGASWSAVIHPEDRDRVLAGWHDAAPNRHPFQAEFRFQLPGEQIVWLRGGAVALCGESCGGYIWTFEDISERKLLDLRLQKAEEALHEEKARADITLDNVGDAVMMVDVAGRVVGLNTAAERMTGWPREEALGSPLDGIFRLIDGTTREAVRNPVEAAMRENRVVDSIGNARLLARDGSERMVEESAVPIHDCDGHIAGAALVFRDVGQAHGIAREMAYLAQHDALTGLPNRGLLADRLAQAIVLAHRHQRKVALLYLDLDHFKIINDSLGHQIGDKLLQSVAERLGRCVRVSDTVSRQGGDEFVVLLAEIEEAQDASVAAEKMIAAFAAPHVIQGSELYITLSIGICIYPDDASCAETMMRNADIAMYHAKRSGRNHYRFFTSDMNDRVVERQEMEAGLRRALSEREFVLHYQPVVNLETGVTEGAEALLRWRSELGLAMPGSFMTVARDSGIIRSIGKWVLHEACRQMREWRDAGRELDYMSVNISTVEFQDRDFLGNVCRSLEETGLPTACLQLEFSESVLMDDADSSRLLLRELREMGLRIAIDDFGAGCSSLSCLRQFQVDAIKIDRSFVKEMTTNADDAAIVSAVIGMGKCLRHRVIAEGVETSEQADFLRSHNCDIAQGFHFSRPLSAEAFADLLSADRVICQPG
ncbi:MAG: putative bifunctional diguanylate cyclase/phosphodiesterase [Betaproteobacteria bacterium]